MQLNSLKFAEFDLCHWASAARRCGTAQLVAMPTGCSEVDGSPAWKEDGHG